MTALIGTERNGFKRVKKFRPGSLLGELSGYTPEGKLPAHHGHEHDGLPYVRALLDRLPGLTDPAGRRLAETVCALHLTARGLENLKQALEHIGESEPPALPESWPELSTAAEQSLS